MTSAAPAKKPYRKAPPEHRELRLEGPGSQLEHEVSRTDGKGVPRQVSACLPLLELKVPEWGWGGLWHYPQLCCWGHLGNREADCQLHGNGPVWPCSPCRMGQPVGGWAWVPVAK